MRADLLTLATAALAMATEIRLGENDEAVLDAILEPLPDESVYEFVALVRTYSHQYEMHGPAALQRCGLSLARDACGLPS